MTKMATKKSVTWVDKDQNKADSASTKTAGSAAGNSQLNMNSLTYGSNSAKPILSIYNLPWHHILILYYMFYIEYDKLIKFETINSVLIKILSLNYCGQLIWLSFLKVKKQNSNKHKRLNLSFSLILGSTLLSIISASFIYFIAVLLGAPILIFQFQTYLLSLNLAFLIVFPVLVVYELSYKTAFNELLFSESLISCNPVLIIGVLTAICCWLGVFTIPLDWDRDWQLYPISLIVGAFGGNLIGGLLAYTFSFL